MPPKVIYVNLALDSITLDAINPIREQATETLKRFLSPCLIKNFAGKDVRIVVDFADIDPELDIFRTARAAPKGESSYAITFGGGLLARLYTLAQAIAADKSVLRGHMQAKSQCRDAQIAGRTEVLHQFCFHAMLIFIAWHEVAHVVLGHLDWLGAHLGVDSIDELSSPVNQHETFLHRRTMEADADRQAALWSCATLDVAMTGNPLLQYSSLRDLFYDAGYIYSGLFCFLDSVDNKVSDELRRHPKPHIRLAIVLSFFEDYFRKHHRDAAQVLQRAVYEGGLRALRNLQYENKEPFDFAATASFIASNGDRIEKMGLRKFQHTMRSESPGSFSFV